MSLLEKLRDATRGTPYEGKIYLVGGIVRDRIMGITEEEDCDLVLEGNAEELADFLYSKGISDHKPVTYSRFRTAMIQVEGFQVEIAGARKESYTPESRKPNVAPATLEEDVFRRDFTINTLLENLHTGEILDLTGMGRADIKAGIIRTPKDPSITFEDDPLRMLRAIRFAARFGFNIEEKTYRAIAEKAARLKIISSERIRDEFVKMLMTSRAADAMEMLHETGLLKMFAPELENMRGVEQNIYHIYDVWTHTMKTLEALPDDAGLELRLAALFHDIGKPSTKTVDENGNVHFYSHQIVGAKMTSEILSRLKFDNETIRKTAKIVEMHLRVGEYDSSWSDTAVRRFIRDAGDELNLLFTLTKADKAAGNTEMPSANIQELEQRIAEISVQIDVRAINSPLNGQEIMAMLGIGEGRIVGEIKDYLVNEIIEGRLSPNDKDSARKIVMQKWGKQCTSNS